MSGLKGKTVIAGVLMLGCSAILPVHAEVLRSSNEDNGLEKWHFIAGDIEIELVQRLPDQSGEVIEQWPVQGLPTTYVIAPDGTIVYRAIGSREWDDKGLLDKVRALK